MGFLDRFRANKPKRRQTKYSIETINTKNDLITALKDVIKAKDITIQAYKKSLSEVIDLESDFELKSDNNILTSDADLVDVLQSTINSRDDIPRPLKQAIASYADTHRPELNSVLNQKVNQLITPAEKKEDEQYGV
tara:strand:+ start:698 stop:1105 length:408 start_codon:yes stop_codon:yes gene_type:complete